MLFKSSAMSRFHISYRHNIQFNQPQTTTIHAAMTRSLFFYHTIDFIKSCPTTCTSTGRKKCQQIFVAPSAQEYRQPIGSARFNRAELTDKNCSVLAALITATLIVFHFFDRLCDVVAGIAGKWKECFPCA